MIMDTDAIKKNTECQGTSTEGDAKCLTRRNPGKSVSDTAVFVKDSVYSRAVSTHRMQLSQKISSEKEEAPLLPCDDKCVSSKGNLHENLNHEKDETVNAVKSEEQTGKQRKQKCHEKSENTEDHQMRNEEDQSTKETKAYYLCLMLVTLLSFLTRFYNIEIPPTVCWDETHFGKMGSWYINRTFFFDVHPPLGKMLIGFAGIITGYDGSFPFLKPGDQYEDEVQYVGMRMFCALLGASLVPLSYQIVWHLTHSIVAGIFASCLILCDTGTTTLSRHILLDPILLFFIMTSTFTCLKFLSFSHKPFSLSWWLWMCLCGVSLAGAVGVKFVGLFVILLVGYTTASDLWRLLANLSVSMILLCKHIMARVVCLIVLPGLVYCLIFFVHFHVLRKSGTGDGFFSSGFQSQLEGNRLYNVSMPQYIAYGSIITMKQRRTGGAYLHSHSHLYPEEHPPKQQQVTTYSHKDENNKWRIKPADRDVKSTEEVVYVHSGDLVRLEHVETRRNLHSHKEVAPLSKRHYQVSGYGQNGTGDANDIWVVDVEGAARGDIVQTVRSKIKFLHYHVRCLLFSHDKKLPKWAWEQLEVTCNPNLRDNTAVWSVEEVTDTRLPNVSFEVYSPSFFEKFLESHAVMTQGNSGLKPKEGEVTSRPWQWPIDYKGQTFSGHNHRIYLLGNPLIFWFLLAAKGIFLLLWAAYSVRQKRKLPINDNLRTFCERTFKVCWWLLLGWFLHYAPFWTMSRVLYFHHYFPAFLFSAMFGGVFLDFVMTLVCVCISESLAIKAFHWWLLLVVAGSGFSFYLFHPLVYGMSGPTTSDEGGTMRNLKWLESWDF